MKNLFYFFVSVFFLSGCVQKSVSDEPEKPDEIEFETSRCVFINNSGVEIAVVIKGRGYNKLEIDFPDSLVLVPDDKYGWDIRYQVTKNEPPYPTVYPPLGEVMFLKLYFDKTIGIDRFRKELQYLDYYTEELNPQKYKHIWTYTFTEEDYQWALEQNKK